MEKEVESDVEAKVEVEAKEEVVEVVWRWSFAASGEEGNDEGGIHSLCIQSGKHKMDARMRKSAAMMHCISFY